MRYLGSKIKLLNNINNVLLKYNITGETFADLFSGTGCVGDFFKTNFKIIANDLLYSSYIISKAKLLNKKTPEFYKFYSLYNTNIFEWLNSQTFTPDERYFIYNNYSPIGNRMFFTQENAIKIDGMRLKIEELYTQEVLEENEYFFLLASLLESITKVSNTSGTYEAFFKFWESRALIPFSISPLEFFNTEEDIFLNEIYNKNTNELIREISGDIAYIDTPYTVTQYISAYHLLETVAKYDFPDIKGVGGKRNREGKNSLYSKKTTVKAEFEDLFRQLNFKHIIISYSTQGLLEIEELINLAKIFAKNNKVYVEEFDYKEYKNHRPSNKSNKLKEVIIYFEKDLEVKKSPLNYSGSKDKLINYIKKELPKEVDIFVDVMGGAFNVGINMFPTKKIVYNEINKEIYELIKMLLTCRKESLVQTLKDYINEFKLEKGNKESYITLRNSYNYSKDIILLYLLHMYSFQNMIRFNSHKKFNTPVGVAGYSADIEERIYKFYSFIKYELKNEDYTCIDWEKYPKNTLFYFDPPYFITNTSYNDGKRGNKGWGINEEIELLDILNFLNNKGYKFILSNVIYHKEKTNHLLLNWIQEHNYKVIEIGAKGLRYMKNEVLIKNY